MQIMKEGNYVSHINYVVNSLSPTADLFLVASFILRCYYTGRQTFDEINFAEKLMRVTCHLHGPVNISAKILKAATPVISPSLSELFSLCIQTSCFPQIWKT